MAEIDTKVVRLYTKYLNKLPLDLANTITDSKDIKGWKHNVQLSIFDFCRLLKIIRDNNDLKELTHCYFDLDFDNIEPIISLLIEENIMTFNEINQYSIKGLDYNKSNIVNEKIDTLNNPKSTFNQFPCAKESVINRVNTLLNDFPFVTSMKVGLMGDDDLLSIEIARRTKFQPIVFELDSSVICKIKKIAKEENLNIKIIKKDLTKTQKTKEELDTFITDPPYTVAGVLTFIYHGIGSLVIKDRFYVIANQMLLGYSGLYEIYRYLIEAGIYPIKILNSYNEYPFPRNYRESIDVRNKYMDKIDPNLIVSSCSSLFVFRINEECNTKNMLKIINSENNIYDRYRRYCHV